MTGEQIILMLAVAWVFMIVVLVVLFVCIIVGNWITELRAMWRQAGCDD